MFTGNFISQNNKVARVAAAITFPQNDR